MLVLWLLLSGLAPKEAPVTLHELYAVLDAQRPEFRELRAREEKLSLLSRPAKALPNPTFSLGVKGSGLTFQTIGKDRMSGGTFSFMQMVPNGRKRELMAQGFLLRAREVEEGLQKRRKELRQKVASAFFSLLFVHEAEKITRENQRLTELLEETARSLYETGKGKQGDLVKVGLARSTLREKELEWQKEEEVLEAELGGLLGLPAPKEGKESLGMLPKLTFRRVELKRAEVLACAQESSPEVIPLQAKKKSEENDVHLAQAKKRWDTGFGGMFMYRGSFNPFWGGEIFFSVPLYSASKEHQELLAERRDVEAVSQMLAQKRVDIQSEVERALASYAKLEQELDLYQTTLLPQARWTVEANLAAYSTGRAGLLDALDAVRSLFEVELREKKFQQEILVQLATLEYHCPRPWLKEAGYE